MISRYINEKNLGFNRNFLTAIQKAKGEYIAIADQDDIWYKYKIEKQIETRVIEKMREKIISNILDGNININDADFEQKMQKFQQSKDLQEKNEMLKDVYNSYLTYLINNSEIFYSK